MLDIPDLIAFLIESMLKIFHGLWEAFIIQFKELWIGVTIIVTIGALLFLGFTILKRIRII